MGYAETDRAVVLAHLDEVQHCFDREQMNLPFLKARVELLASVTTDGQLAAVQLWAMRGGSSHLEACIREAVGQWRFPQVTNGHSRRLVYAFVFE